MAICIYREGKVDFTVKYKSNPKLTIGTVGLDLDRSQAEKLVDTLNRSIEVVAEFTMTTTVGNFSFTLQVNNNVVGVGRNKDDYRLLTLRKSSAGGEASLSDSAQLRLDMIIDLVQAIKGYFEL